MDLDQLSPAEIASRFINSTNRHVFLTGKAGTGKTTFLRNIINHTHKNAVIVAPTGIAAINAGGVTIHSLFQLPFASFLPERGAASLYPGFNDPSTMMPHMQMRSKKRRLIQELELLIIDEVSMLRADILDAIDTVLKHVRRRPHQSFGGVQVLFIGDLLQLPPVVRDDEWNILSKYYRSIFFFEARALAEHKPFYIELDKIYRQSDDKFIGLLNNLRTARVTTTDEELLNRHYKPGFRPALDENYIHLTTHNSVADKLNRDSLSDLKGKTYRFSATVEGDFGENQYPVERNLELKLNAQVMFIKNDLSGSQRYFNGKIGKVTSLDDEKIKVSFDDGSQPVEVDLYTWENVRYELDPVTNEVKEKVVGKFIHYPLKLAWAITVHKSQGLTFSKAIVDIGQAFAPGQVYVALSRLRSLDGLILTSKVNFSSLRQDQSVTEYTGTRDSLETASHVLKAESGAFLRDYLLECFNLRKLSVEARNHSESYTKEEQRSVKQKQKDWANDLYSRTEELRLVADKFRNQVTMLISAEDHTILAERVGKAAGYFIPLLKELDKSIIEQINEHKGSSRVKQFIDDLQDLELSFFSQIQSIRKGVALLESLLSGAELTKDQKWSREDEQERKKLLDAPAVIKAKVAKGSKKKAKGDSGKESYKLFQEGKSISEIAAERKLSVSTIEKHLSHFVQTGELEPTSLLPEERINTILECAASLDKISLTAVREKLGNEFTYSEIRFALSSLPFAEDRFGQ